MNSAKRTLVATALLLLTAYMWMAQEPQASGGQPAQAEKEYLKGLTKAPPDASDTEKEMILNPSITPMYLEDGTQLKGPDFVKAMMSGRYVPEAYVDEKNEIKAYVLREASEEEKRLIQLTNDNPAEKNELVGKDAKPFSVKDIKGRKYSLKKLKGKLVVVNFLFLEGKQCRDEIPELNKLVDEYKDEKVVFLGLANTEKEMLKKFLGNHEFKYSLAAGCSAIARDYGVTVYPTHMIIGTDSKVEYFKSGSDSETIAALKSEIDKQLKK
jgi:peroxiredoxin